MKKLWYLVVEIAQCLMWTTKLRVSGSLDDMIDENYGVAVQFDEDEEEVKQIRSTCRSCSLKLMLFTWAYIF